MHHGQPAEGPGLAELIAEAAEQLQALMLTGQRRRRSPPSATAANPELAQRVGLVKPEPMAPEHGQGLLVAADGGGIVARQLLHLAQVGEGHGLGERVVRVAGQGQRLPVAGGGGRVVPGVLLHQPKMVERVGLARLSPRSWYSATAWASVAVAAG